MQKSNPFLYKRRRDQMTPLLGQQNHLENCFELVKFFFVLKVEVCVIRYWSWGIS